ncbi:MAG: PTS glucose transporter subunit IIA [Butyrivibrio sp.]|nr:PTS glucose transporter subunit IIA [Butyrivibrio sp.]
MGLFDKLFQSKKIEICAPAKGELVPISNVSDPAFSEEMVGKGVALKPSEGRFYAPCDGTLAVLFPTGHAYCLKSSEGAEVLIHIGIDTVKLEGKCFTIHAKQGDEVKKGDLIVEVDLNGVKEAGYDTITPIIISNPDDFSNLEKKEGNVSAGEAAILLSK